MRQKTRHRHPRQGAKRHRVPHTQAASSAQPADAPHEAVVRDEKQAVFHILSTGHSAVNALKLGAHALSSTSSRITQSPYHDQYACRAGCSWCCYIPVAVTPPEALVMAQFLRDHCSAAELTEVRARLAANAVRSATLSLADQADARLPCALLRHGQCMVYEARPIRCRRWNSVDSTACEAGFHDAGAQIVPVDTYAFEAGRDVQAGLHAGITQRGLDGTRYELHSAVWRALEMADAADRWVCGETVFGDCTPIARGGDLSEGQSVRRRSGDPPAGIDL